MLHRLWDRFILAATISQERLSQTSAASINNWDMTLYEFLHSEEIEQVEAFYDGVFIGRRSNGAFVMECRQINDFYVEYKILGGHYIDMSGFKNPMLLEPYLNQVDISQLGIL